MKRPVSAILFLFLVACSSTPMSKPQTNVPTSIPLQLPEKWTETPTATFTPTKTLTPIPTSTPIPTNTFERLATGLFAQPPSDADLKNVKSIWTLTNFHELLSPGSVGYFVRVTHNSVWLWDWYFCAAAESFKDFIASTDLEFRLDNQLLREADNLRVYDNPGGKGWICRIWTTKLSEWPVDRTVELEINYTYKTAVNDGKTDYPAGEYYEQIWVFVKE